MIASYVSLILLFSFPSVQKTSANWIADVLSDNLGTRCTIASINPGLFNRLILDDLYLEDKNRKPILKVARISVSIDLIELWNGRIDISTSQLFTPRGLIYKDKKRDEMNYQFIADAFKSDDDTESTPLNIRINSLIVRHLDLRYEDSLHFEDVGFNLSLKTLTKDSINVSLHRFSGSERFMGLGIRNLEFDMAADTCVANVRSFRLATRRSTLNFDSLSFSIPGEKQLPQVSPFTLSAHVVPSEFSTLLPQLEKASTPLHLEMNAKTEGNRIDITSLQVNDITSSAKLDMLATLTLDNMRIDSAHAEIGELSVNNSALRTLLTEYGVDTSSVAPIMSLDNIMFSGVADHNSKETSSTGKLLTSGGNIDFNGSMFHPENRFRANLVAEKLALGTMLNDATFGILDLDVSVSGTPKKIANSHIYATLQEGNLQLGLEAELAGSSIDDLKGHADIFDLSYADKQDTIEIDRINIVSESILAEDHYSLITDFCKIDLQGILTPTKLPKTLLSMVGIHLPTLFKGRALEYTPDNSNEEFNYSMAVWDDKVLNKLLKTNLSISEPITASGMVSSSEGSLSLILSAPAFCINDTKVNDVILDCHNTPYELSLAAKAYLDKTLVNINATASEDTVHSAINANISGKTPLNLNLASSTAFSDSLGSMFTKVNIEHSSVQIKDTTWNITPALISLYKKEIKIDNFNVHHDDSYLTVSGTTGEGTNDSIVAELNNLNVEYILDAVDFTAVSFGGYASGKAIACNILDSKPTLHTDLRVQDFKFNNGLMGHEANINGKWNNDLKRIELSAHITDTPLPSGEEVFTDVNGFIAPDDDDIFLRVEAHNTRSYFLNGFVDGFMHETNGNIRGTVDVVGPLSCVGLEGEVEADLDISLLATDVPYHLEKQKVTFEKECFHFDNITITDRYGNRGEVNGQVTHSNFTDFGFDFKVDFHQLLAYEEKQFNADKYMATVFANGDLKIKGHDGRPMYITANLTPTKGSTFAYDAATPDAITSNSFIIFRDPTKTQAVETAETSDYKDDLYVDFNVNLNNDCEIKLLMDNKVDGYITTYGNARLQAKYYNKGAFQLFGTYNINRGSYRLYLQDLIFKDLAIQEGSSVEFNGAPFDANIHLICHHTINSVPITDLTGTTFSQNNKVKVICKLDITGNLGNMNFGFDLDLPNSNDEIKQLVRSSISTEEEMNTQMIYLLGVGRFYPTSYARTTTESASSSAVNSIVSSTLSGQLNNLISKVMGPNSNWSFGANISTGEKGWNDIDAEGTLSGHLFNDRLLINGSFGYRDNTLTNQGMIIGDFEVKWRLLKNSNKLYLRAYNQTNDRYFTKATLNTQGIGINFQHEFESWKTIFKK